MNENVNNFVQEYRNKNKVTQEELGSIVGVTRQTIIAIERGTIPHPYCLLSKLQNTLIQRLKNYL